MGTSPKFQAPKIACHFVNNGRRREGYSSGTSSSRSRGETPRALANRSSVSVVTERYGSLNSERIVVNPTSERCESLVMEMPFS